jgi:hypothetical protein
MNQFLLRNRLYHVVVGASGSGNVLSLPLLAFLAFQPHAERRTCNLPSAQNLLLCKAPWEDLGGLDNHATLWSV